MYTSQAGNDTSFVQVTEVKSQLSMARAQQDKLKAELDTAKSIAEAAKRREQQLRQEIEELRFLMDEAHAKADAASHRVSSCRHLDLSVVIAWQVDLKTSDEHLLIQRCSHLRALLVPWSCAAALCTCRKPQQQQMLLLR